MRRHRVGIFCPGIGTGGPWRYVHSVLTGIDPAEVDVTVFCDLPGKYEPQPWVKVVNLDLSEVPPAAAAMPAAKETSAPARSSHHRMVPTSVRLWAGFAKQSRRLARLFRQHPVDIFHTQNTGCEESPVAAKLAGIRHIIGTFHVDSTYDLHHERNGPGHRLLEILSNRCLDTAIAVSGATKSDWLRRTHIPAGRVTTIHNGIDPEKFRRRQSRESARRELGLSVDGLLVGGLGRLDEAKGFTHLLEAAARLRPEFPNLCVAIAGAGPLRESLERQSARLDLGSAVRFLGFQSDVQKVLDSLDVYAIPSLCEALPFALLEAMAAELPAVGSTVGGIPEVIVPGVTGLLVSPRDPVRLAEGLRTLLLNTELRTRMGIAGREQVIRHFHERDMVRKTIGVYRKALL